MCSTASASGSMVAARSRKNVGDSVCRWCWCSWRRSDEDAADEADPVRCPRMLFRREGGDDIVVFVGGCS